MEALTYLEPKVSSGGFVLLDDIFDIPQCLKAVTEYRAAKGIEAEIIQVDWTGAYWRKP